MKKIAIIPARGGSKRIPKKNVKEFCGKPIIAYSIELSLDSKLFDIVMVSTDDDEIAEISRRYGAEVPFLRSVKNSDDFATTADVLMEVLEAYAHEKGQTFDYTCCIYPTAPLLQLGILKKAFEKMVAGNFCSVFPVVKFSYPIYRALQFGENEKISMIWPPYLKTRSQDIPACYHDAGQFYWLETGQFKRNRQLYSDKSSAVVLEDRMVQDIDTLSDWRMAELKYQLLKDEL